MSEAATKVWKAPELNPSPGSLHRMPTVDELQAVEASARQAGFKAGHAEGFAAGQTDVRKLIAQIEGIVASFSRPLSQLDEEVLNAIGDLSVNIAGALMAREYAADTQLLKELVTAAIESVGNVERQVEVRLHSDDLAAIGSSFPKLPTVRFVADSSIRRGDVRVHADSVRIDGALESRLKTTLAELMDRDEATP